MYCFRLPVFIGYILALMNPIIIYIIYFRHRKEVMQDLRGKDGRWQPMELSAVTWLIIFPTLIACDLLGVHAHPLVWSSMDVIYLVNVGGKAYIAAKVAESAKKEENKNEGKTSKTDGIDADLMP